MSGYFPTYPAPNYYYGFPYQPAYQPMGHALSGHLTNVNASNTSPLKFLPEDNALQYLKQQQCLDHSGQMRQAVAGNLNPPPPLDSSQALSLLSVINRPVANALPETDALKILKCILKELGPNELNVPILDITAAGNGLYPLLASKGYFHRCLVQAGMNQFPLSNRNLTEQFNGDNRISIRITMYREGEKNLLLIKNALRQFIRKDCGLAAENMFVAAHGLWPGESPWI